MLISPHRIPLPDYWPSASSHSRFGAPGINLVSSLSVDDTDHLVNVIDISTVCQGWHRRRLGESEEVTPKILEPGRTLPDSNLDCPEHPLAVANDHLARSAGMPANTDQCQRMHNGQ